MDVSRRRIHAKLRRKLKKCFSHDRNVIMKWSTAKILGLGMSLKPFQFYSYLRKIGFIIDPQFRCVKCTTPTMRLTRNSKLTDGVVWRCARMRRVENGKRERCGSTISVRKNTFFARSNLTFSEVI